MPDAIVAVLRGGVVPALVLSDVLGADEFYAIRVKHWGIARELYSVPLVEQLPQGRIEGKSVLLVDEVADTGKTLARAIEELMKLGAAEVKTAVLHLKPTSTVAPDYYAVKLDEWAWIFYPWSLAETLLSLAVRELGEATSAESIARKASEIASRLGVEHYKKNIIEVALKLYSKKYKLK